MREASGLAIGLQQNQNPTSEDCLAYSNELASLEVRSPSRACPFDCRYTILDSAPVQRPATASASLADARSRFQVDFIIAKGFSEMTYLDMVFPYGANPGENELRAIDGMREVYGVLQVFFNEKDRTVRVKFDASRLKRDAVARLLRQAGIDVGEPLVLA